MSTFKKQTGTGGGKTQDTPPYERSRNLNIAENAARMSEYLGNTPQEFVKATETQAPAKRAKKAKNATPGQKRQSDRNRKQIKPAKEDVSDNDDDDSDDEDNDREKQPELKEARSVKQNAEASIFEDEESEERDSEDQPPQINNAGKTVVFPFHTFKPPSSMPTQKEGEADIPKADIPNAEILEAFDAPARFAGRDDDLALITPEQTRANPMTTGAKPAMTPENEQKLEKLTAKFLNDEITVAQFDYFAKHIPGATQSIDSTPQNSTLFKGEGQVRGSLNNTFSRALHWFVALPFQKPFANLTCSFCFSQAGRQHRTRFGYPIADGSRQQ